MQALEFFVKIDTEKGELIGPGLKFLSAGNEIIYKHPDTSVTIDGFSIPFFNESKEMVKDAAVKLGDKLVGWDIAITEKGPIIIEGNHNNHFGL